jgi:pSer/pThr/pTyr-binding forkhead associated (FHA) protein
MAKLIIQTGKLAGKPLTIPSKEVVIGRDEGCFIRMGSVDISRRHCSLRATVDGILVTDLGSSNGTLVNDILITAPTILRVGDRLRVGPAVFLADGPKPKIDDSAIEDWLNDGDSKTELASNEDTAIFKNESTVSSPPHETTATPVAHAHHTAPKPKRTFHSTAEEAQYVIALYRERQAKLAELDK